MGQFGASYFYMPISSFLSVCFSLLFFFCNIPTLFLNSSSLDCYSHFPHSCSGFPLFACFLLAPPTPCDFPGWSKRKVRINCHSESKPRVTSDDCLTCPFNSLKFRENCTHREFELCLCFVQCVFILPAAKISNPGQ